MLSIPPNPFREDRLNAADDYRADWDVLDLNAKFSSWLVDEVRGLVDRAEPDPGQKIAVITGPPGYGKTHLFGRIQHQVGQDVFFVFVPAFEPEKPPLDHIRRHVVAALFRKLGDHPSPLELALARLCRPAFADYFADLPPTLAARHDSIRRRLGETPVAVLELLRPVKTLAPFARLADSLVAVLPSEAGVVRALALGWAPSPWSDIAKRWLQGQDLPEAEVQALGLNLDPPTTMDVLKAIPVLLRHQQPMIICCDQIEGIAQRSELVGPFTQSLMELLQAVPVQIVLSAFQDTWEGQKDVREGFNAFKAFNMRVQQPLFKLDALKPDQANRLIIGRMNCWPEHPLGKPPIWPFDESNVREYVVDRMPTPRALIQECARKFNDWSEGERTETVTLQLEATTVVPGQGGGGNSRAFLVEWNDEIDAIKRNPERAVGSLDQERLYRGVLEALKLAHSAQRLRSFGGVRIVDIQDKVVKATKPVVRPGAAVSIAGEPGEAAQAIVVALTTIESARSFSAYFTALKKASDEVGAAGVLMMHPRRDLTLSHNAKTWMELERKDGRFRFLALEDHPLTFQAIEALVALLIRAESRELVLNGVSMTQEDVRDLVIKTGVIDNLDLFKLLGHAKKPAAQAKPAQAAAPGPKVAPTAEDSSPTASRSPTPPPTVPPQAEVKPPDPPPAPAVDYLPWAAEKLAQAVKKLKVMGQDVEPDGFEVGPTFVRLRVAPLGKTNFQMVRNRSVDLRMALGLNVVPIVESQAGCISVDVQRPDRATVTLGAALGDEPAGLGGKAAFPVGQDVGGQTHWLDLGEPADCHLLVAGTTGSGKSEFLRAAVAALASRLGPDQVQFLLVDPKRVTFNLARPSPYLRAPVAHDVDEALPLIKQVMEEMDRRFAVLERQGKSNVADLAAELVPRVVVVIDEFASFLEEKESKKLVTALLKRIGAMARAAGIHLILATQRPDKDVVTPVLRENLPGRIALHVTNKAGSDLILGSPEAEHLLGKGDLFWKKGGELLRLQSPFASQAELEAALRMGPG